MSRRLDYMDQVRAHIGPSARLGVSAKRDAGYTIYLHCTECHQEQPGFHSQRRLPPDQVAKRMKNAGWEIGPRRQVCPLHQNERKEPQVANDETPVIHSAAAPLPHEPTDKAKRAKRETVLLLDEVFDVAKGCFKGGESDESVAKTVGLATEAVVKIREDMFGPLKTPPELAGFIEELNAMKVVVNDLNREQAGKIVAIEDKMDAMRKRIENFCKMRGWSL